MTASVIRRLSCNRPGCPSTVTAPPGVDHLYALRRMARESGWSVTGVGNDRLDYCPLHATPEASHAAPCRFPSSPDCTCGGGR